MELTWTNDEETGSEAAEMQVWRSEQNEKAQETEQGKTTFRPWTDFVESILIFSR